MTTIGDRFKFKVLKKVKEHQKIEEVVSIERKKKTPEKIIKQR